MFGKRLLPLALLGALLFLCDFFSKEYVHSHIPLMQVSPAEYPYGGIPLFRDLFGVNFSINQVLNKGTAWGLFASLQTPLLYLRIALVSGLVAYLLFFNRDRFRDIPLLLIAVGAIGNIVDYFRYGAVVDMFYFTFGSYAYPLFNVADSAICIGVGLLFLRFFRETRPCHVE